MAMTKEQVEYGAEYCANLGHYPSVCRCLSERATFDLDAAKARIAELEGALREEIEDLEELAVVNENGWSARDRSNRFNDGAAVIQREMAAKLRALLTTPSSTGERRG